MECLMADEITERECELGVFGELKRGKIGHRLGSKDRLTSDCHRSRDRLQIRCRQNRLASSSKSRQSLGCSCFLALPASTILMRRQPHELEPP